MKLVLAACMLLFFSSTCSAWYVYGSFSSSASGSTGTSANYFFDDGLHGDGVAGDGIYGVDITVDQPAGSYYWNVQGSMAGSGGYPECWCTAPPTGVYRLWTSGPGDVIHFRYDARARGFVPSRGFSCDHAKPVGTPAGMKLSLDRSFMGSLDYDAVRVDTLWECVVQVGGWTGSHSFAFMTPSGSVVFGASYNGGCGGGCDSNEEPKNQFSVAALGTYVRFQFDETSGQMRATELGTVPTRSRTWGTLKSLYR